MENMMQSEWDKQSFYKSKEENSKICSFFHKPVRRTVHRFLNRRPNKNQYNSCNKRYRRCNDWHKTLPGKEAKECWHLNFMKSIVTKRGNQTDNNSAKYPCLQCIDSKHRCISGI